MLVLRQKSLRNFVVYLVEVKIFTLNVRLINCNYKNMRVYKHYNWINFFQVHAIFVEEALYILITVL